jgi:Beta-propeller repeat
MLFAHVPPLNQGCGFTENRFILTMKNKFTSRPAPTRPSFGEDGFLNPHIFVALVVVFTGVLFALFARANPQRLTGERPRHADKVSPTPSGKVQEAWVTSYNGPGNYVDQAAAVAVDDSGNVYVTGGSYGADGSSDYATIKYNAAGQEEWIARYNGPAAEGNDVAVAIAVDGSGNVYLTGSSVGPDGFPDYATIKYSSNGQEQWVARYNGPDAFFDEATAIAVDSSGNVYVTGSSYDSDSTSDYATIKYDSAGQEQWVSRYDASGQSFDNPSAIAIDGSGAVYVTGSSALAEGAAPDYATIKYDAAGQEQWVARYDGPGASDDNATAIAIDGSANVYVTGWSVGVTFDFDYATIKYDVTGQEQWVARYDGAAAFGDLATAIAVDGTGVYVTGAGGGSALGQDYTTIKYDSAGQEQWVASYDGPGDADDYATAIVTDGSGNAFVTGASFGATTGYDYATIKYDTSGQEQWAARYNGPANFDDQTNAIAIDDSGNVYVTGLITDQETDFDFATIKYVQGVSPTPTPTATATPTVTPSPTAPPRSTPTPRVRPSPHPRPTPSGL